MMNCLNPETSFDVLFMISSTSLLYAQVPSSGVGPAAAFCITNMAASFFGDFADAGFSFSVPTHLTATALSFSVFHAPGSVSSIISK
jgi:hypothetical protein